MNGYWNDHTEFLQGYSYVNKHNGRIIKITEREISDTGRPIWTAEYGEGYEYYLTKGDGEHWTLITNGEEEE